MKIGTSEVKKVFIGSTEVKKIYVGTSKVWENWILKTSNFYDLTSNTAPSPFIASMITSKTSGEAWNVFDDNGSSGIQANYFSPSTLGLGVKLLFGKSIRIVKLKVRGRRSGQSNWTCSVYGIKEDNSKSLIHQAVITAGSDITINSNDSVTEFKGLECYVDTRGDLIVNLDSCQVTEYYSKD